MDLDTFGSLLMSLYNHTPYVPLRDFRQEAMKLVREYLPFDGVVWTTRRASGQRSSRYMWIDDGVTQHINELFEHYSKDRSLTDMARNKPGEPQAIRISEMDPDSLLYRLSELSGMSQLLMTAVWNKALGSFCVITIGRKGMQNAFSPDEIEMKRLITPHLEAAARHNFESRIHACAMENISASTGISLVSEEIFSLAEPKFLNMMREAWPDWEPPTLPTPFLSAIKDRKPILSQGRISFHLFFRAKMTIVIATHQLGLDRLTRKEYTIASEFSSGKSYKQVARIHGLSPETVRSRLRAVYEKLNISDKAELSNKFNQDKMIEKFEDLL